MDTLQINRPKKSTDPIVKTQQLTIKNQQKMALPAILVTLGLCVIFIRFLLSYC